MIAVAGETVALRDGAIVVNGQALDEPYIADPACRDFLLGIRLEKNGVLKRLRIESGLVVFRPPDRMRGRRTEDFADGRRVAVRLSAEELAPRRVSCRDEKLEAPTRWSLESVTEV